MTIRFMSVLAIALCVAFLGTSTALADENLLLNPGFETSSSNFLGTSFEDREGTASMQSVETTDILEGTQAAHITAGRSGSLYQELSLGAATTGQMYELTIHYKVLSAAGTLALNSYWESNTAGQLQHDEDSLWVSLPAGTGWQTFTTHTTKPQDGSKLHIALAYTKNMEVLLDDFSLVETTSSEPWFTITPEAGGSASCYVGDSVLVKTYTVRQGNLTAPVTAELVGQNADQWFVTASSMTADTASFELWYRPTMAGNHRASLLVDCTAATTCSRIFSLTGAASNPAATPVITLSPAALPTFVCAVGQTITDTVRVSAVNCSDYINISLVNDNNSGAFTLNNAQMPANVQNGLSVIRFHPLTAGTFTAMVSYATEGGQTQTVSLTGMATGAPAPVGYDTAFHFTNQGALATLTETFDAVGHNTPLALAGWQNVVRHGQRPWWGIDSVNDEEMYCAKATAFLSGVSDTINWDMWLVTPALDYVGAPAKQFTFRVRGDYLYDDMPTALEVYYIDATDTNDVYMQLIEAAIPKTADEKGNWYDIVVDLTGQTTIADVFYMAFRYVGPGGIDGSPTYFVDDVKWGQASTAVDGLTMDNARCTMKTVQNGRLYLLRDGATYDALGRKMERMK